MCNNLCVGLQLFLKDDHRLVVISIRQNKYVVCQIV